jgi:magnesium transporter
MTVRLFKRAVTSVGSPPGTLVHTGEKKVERTRVTVMEYDASSYVEDETAADESCAKYKETQKVTWINVQGLHEVETLRQLAEDLDLHPLVIEDILDTTQRPKLETYDHYTYMVARVFHYPEANGQVSSEQISIVLFPRLVVTFQEGAPDVFEPVRARIRSGIGRIRTSGADYLAYALLGAIVDTYFIVIEQLGERIEELEQKIVAAPSPTSLTQLHHLKRQTALIRRALWPLREVVNALLRGDTNLVQETTTVFIRDVYDHTIEVAETIETFREILSGLLDIYLSSISNRLNEVMKVLTIMATVFIPLTFIAGVYGMNFKYMPELEQPWGYPACWLVMLGVGGLMLLYFRRKKWL